MLKYILNVFTTTFDQFNVSIHNKNINFLINVLSNPHCSYHISQGDVKEHATSKGKDDAGGKSATQQDAQDQAQVAGHSRQQVEEDGLWNTQPCVQQDNEVAYRGRQNANVLHMFLFFHEGQHSKGSSRRGALAQGLKVRADNISCWVNESGFFLPSSWGNSSQTIAIEVLKPLRIDTVNEAPMASPSMKLWRASLREIIHATVFTPASRLPLSHLQYPCNDVHI